MYTMSSHVTVDNNICIEKVQHLVYNWVVELDHWLGKSGDRWVYIAASTLASNVTSWQENSGHHRSALHRQCLGSWLLQCIDHCFENQNVRPHNIAALFSQCVPKNALTHVPQAHPQLHLANCLKPRSKTTQSSRQRRDTKQRRGGRGLTGKATCHDTISLIITNECLERLFYFIDPCNYENGGSISFRCRRSRAEGVLNNY